MLPVTAGRKRSHDLPNRRREDVDPADDQHVVGATDAPQAEARATARARRSSTPARGRACGSAGAAPHDDEGASARARRSASSASSTGDPVSGSISSTWTKSRAPRCMPACSSHSPKSETPMSPTPIASVTLAPQPASSFARRAGSPPPALPRRAPAARSSREDRGLTRRPPRSGAQHTTGSSPRPRAATARSHGGGARCRPSRPECGRGRSDRTPRAPLPPRTGRRCTSRPPARPQRRRTLHRSGPSRSPSSRDRLR